MPQWSCFVDGQPIDQSSNETVGNGQLELCSKANVLDGMHKLVVNVSATEDTPFWFDYIEYLPSAGSLNQTDAVYGWDDPMIECDSTWDKKKDWTMTTTTGSMMSFDFNGEVAHLFHPREVSMLNGSPLNRSVIDLVWHIR